MANSRIEDLTALTTPSSDDVLVIVDDPVGTPITKKMAISGLSTYLASLTQTLTNKTLTTPIISTISNTGTITLPTATTTLVGRDTTDTLTNKTISAASNTITGVATTSNKLSDFAATTSAELATVISNETGSGLLVFATSPTLTTPVLGVATATSINGLTITSSTGVLTITNAKTLAVTNTLTLSGTDSTTMTFPSTTATIARTDAAQTFTGTQTFTQTYHTNNAIAASGNAATVPITSKVNTVTNNSAATLTITMTTTSATDGQTSIVRVLDSSAAAQTITWVNTENSQVTVPTTSNGSTTLPLTVGFMYNSSTSKWRCVASA